MRHFALFACALLALPAAAADVVLLTSPDRKLVVTLANSGTEISWKAEYLGKPVLLESRLGLSLYSGAYEVVRHTITQHAGVWSPPYGERRTIPERYRELTVELKDRATPFRSLQVILRAYDEGFAVRYRIAGEGPFLYASESTRFRLPAGTFAWEQHGTESPYARVPVGAIRRECERPLTLDYGNGIFASILEAANTDYPRMLLSPVRGQADTVASDLGGPVTGNAPYLTPWRAVIVADRPGTLLERNYLVDNLNLPSAIRDTSWIKPGKIIREVLLSTKGGKACVDFAVKNGLQYIEYDAGWYGHEYDELSDATRVSLDPLRVRSIPDHGGLDLEEVIRYARERNIGVWLYVNRRALERQAGQLFRLYERWGVKGVKFGFVNVGPQQWTAWLHDAVRQAGEHHLMVDIHDNYRPTGTSRLYPNLLTQEGVRGNENMPGAGDNTVLPFTRFLAGAADATICYFDKRIKTTRAHQLALAVVFYSPLQFLYWYDQPSAHHGEPETEFFARVPTVWDDTRVLDGKIGEYVTVARQSGQEWYVGSITNQAARQLEIPLAFLAPGRQYTARMYTEAGIESRAVNSRTVVRAALADSGGHAMLIAPAR